jgi:hypothetical protein
MIEQLARSSAASPLKRVPGIDLRTRKSTVPQAQLPLAPAGSPRVEPRTSHRRSSLFLAARDERGRGIELIVIVAGG